jgi:hypothetical protein
MPQSSSSNEDTRTSTLSGAECFARGAADIAGDYASGITCPNCKVYDGHSVTCDYADEGDE